MRKLDALTREKVIIDALNSGIAHLKAWITPNRISGRPGLIYRTGNLARMIQPRPARRIGYEIIASLNAGAIYSRIHEFGSAGLPGGVIRPKTKKFLSWIDTNTGKRRFAKEVKIPARPFMGPAIQSAENRQFIMEELLTRVRAAITETK